MIQLSTSAVSHYLRSEHVIQLLHFRAFFNCTPEAFSPHSLGFHSLLYVFRMLVDIFVHYNATLYTDGPSRRFFFWRGGGGGNLAKDPIPGYPKIKNSTDLAHYFLG